MLIGVERERRNNNQTVTTFGGIRTMSLVGMLGYLVFYIFSGSVLLFSIFTGAFLLLIVSEYVVSGVIAKDFGATSEIATIFVYLSGILVGMGELVLATVVTLTVLLLLYFKEPLHAFVNRVEKEEIYDTIKFIVVVFVIFPLLPNKTFGPLDVLNPHTIWLVVVLVSSISFVSYVAIKFFGSKKGMGLGGFLGGLISSTAVAMSFSALSKKSKKIINPFVFGILIASSAMFFRVLFETSVLNVGLFHTLLLPMFFMGGTGILISMFFWFKRDHISQNTTVDKQLNFKTPFQLWSALQFGFFFAALLFISKFASINYGEQGLFVTSFLSGFVDVDAITVSMANLSANGDITNLAATVAISIATMTNTFVKGMIVLFFGSTFVGRKVFFSMILIILAGISALVFFTPELYGLTSLINGGAW